MASLGQLDVHSYRREEIPPGSFPPESVFQTYALHRFCSKPLRWFQLYFLNNVP